MLTNDWFWKIKCSIEDQYVVVEGNKYKIEALEEDDVYHMKLNICLGMLIIVLIYTVFLWGYGAVPELLTNKDTTDITVKISVMVFAISCIIYGIVILLKAKKYKGCWKVNGVKYLYLEKTDGLEVYETLRHLQKLLNT